MPGAGGGRLPPRDAARAHRRDGRAPQCRTSCPRGPHRRGAPRRGRVSAFPPPWIRGWWCRSSRSPRCPVLDDACAVGPVFVPPVHRHRCDSPGARQHEVRLDGPRVARRRGRHWQGPIDLRTPQRARVQPAGHGTDARPVGPRSARGGRPSRRPRQQRVRPRSAAAARGRSSLRLAPPAARGFLSPGFDVCSPTTSTRRRRSLTRSPRSASRPGWKDGTTSAQPALGDTQMPVFEVGHVVDRYRVDHIVHTSRFTVVYAATDVALGRKTALESLSNHYRARPRLPGALRPRGPGPSHGHRASRPEHGPRTGHGRGGRVPVPGHAVHRGDDAGEEPQPATGRGSAAVHRGPRVPAPDGLGAQPHPQPSRPCAATSDRATLLVSLVETPRPPHTSSTSASPRTSPTTPSRLAARAFFLGPHGPRHQTRSTVPT